MNDTSDKEILTLFKSEETREDAFCLLLGKYQKRVYWHVRRMVIDHEDANDITQNVFVKIWKGLINFREESMLFSWIYRIATNESITFIKQKQRNTTISIEDIDGFYPDSNSSDSQMSSGDIERKLHKAIMSLPEKQRIVFNLRYYDEMPYAEMSLVLKTSTGALKASYHLALKKIEKILASD
ncbi:MAG: RNA polymerase sigma factor [Bacteroidales bacterium]|nr:RNA polymerase sigma factor [Bacteroidales bacterium]